MFSKIERLKREARKHYQAYQRELDSIDCGKTVAEEINPRITKAKLAFNDVMDALSELDKNCPKTRL